MASMCVQKAVGFFRLKKTIMCHVKLAIIPVIPQPVYMNSEELGKMRETALPSDDKLEDLPDDDLKTPTIEELAFPGQRLVRI